MVLRSSPEPSRQQLLRNCRSACDEDCAFEDDGETTIWFEPIDCHEQESADDDNRANIETS
jgi:hypothetical protein